MLKSIIVDDEAPSAKSLNLMLSKYCPQIEVVGIASGVEAGEHLIREMQPEVVFMDIQMKDGTGFDLLERLPEINFKLIFTTSYDQYAVKAFRYSALDYLLKPINPEDLISSVARLNEQIRMQDMERQVKMLLKGRDSFEKIALPTSEGIRFVQVNTIIRCESDGNYTQIYLTSGEKLLVARTLKIYDEILPSDMFFRVHKSHLVNMDQVKQFVFSNGGYIVMFDNTRVEIAQRKKEEFLKIILRQKK
jgi:two-component system, LytTR family, response regulator